MAKLSIEEIIAAVEELSVLELNDLVKACEEMGELTQAICKLFDKSVDAFDVESVVEELADVEIMLEQVRIALDVDPMMEAGWRDRKLRRLRRRLRRLRRLGQLRYTDKYFGFRLYMAHSGMLCGRFSVWRGQRLQPQRRRYRGSHVQHHRRG